MIIYMKIWGVVGNNVSEKHILSKIVERVWTSGMIEDFEMLGPDKLYFIYTSQYRSRLSTNRTYVSDDQIMGMLCSSVLNYFSGLSIQVEFLTAIFSDFKYYGHMTKNSELIFREADPTDIEDFMEDW